MVKNTIRFFFRFILKNDEYVNVLQAKWSDMKWFSLPSVQYHLLFKANVNASLCFPDICEKKEETCLIIISEYLSVSWLYEPESYKSNYSTFKSHFSPQTKLFIEKVLSCIKILTLRWCMVLSTAVTLITYQNDLLHNIQPTHTINAPGYWRAVTLRLTPSSNRVWAQNITLTMKLKL